MLPPRSLTKPREKSFQVIGFCGYAVLVSCLQAPSTDRKRGFNLVFLVLCRVGWLADLQLRIGDPDKSGQIVTQPFFDPAPVRGNRNKGLLKFCAWWRSLAPGS